MKILVLGGDKRYISLMNNLDYPIDCVGYTNKRLNENIVKKKIEDINLYKYDIVILPILGINDNFEINSLDGMIKLDKELFDNSRKNCIFYTGLITDMMHHLFENKDLVSFLQDKEVKQGNDALTIEGVLEKVNEKNRENITILGFGNLGSKLSHILSDYNINIGTNDEYLADHFPRKFFLTTNKQAMKIYFKSSDYIINTVPNNIIDEDLLKCTSAHVLDIASSPYGMDKDISKNYFNYHLYSSIPSKYAPEEAGKILAKKIIRDQKGKNI